jgi:serine/threonine protein phosphatase PrpC
MRFCIFQDTRIGSRRVNQDRTGYAYGHERAILVVADGMGGHPRGELAAHLAVESVLGGFADWTRKDGRDAAQMLHSAFGAAHRAIHRCAERERLWDLPRTTCAACVIRDGIALWSHVGDSRLYFVRDGSILATTRDHSGAWLLVEQGLITPEDARRHPDRNFVYNCLGGEVGPEIDMAEPVAVVPGDRILLCSDGFWSPLRNEEIAAALSGAAPEAALQVLLGDAEERAGEHADNLSYVGLMMAGDDAPGALLTGALAPGEVVMRFARESVSAAP